MGVGANRIADRPQYPGIADDYRRTFATLKAMRADVYLTAHAEQFDLAGQEAPRSAGAPNPFVDPTELPRRVGRAGASRRSCRRSRPAGPAVMTAP